MSEETIFLDNQGSVRGNPASLQSPANLHLSTQYYFVCNELHFNITLVDDDDDDDDDDDEVLLYVHRNHRFIRDGSPGRPPRLSHSS